MSTKTLSLTNKQNRIYGLTNQGFAIVKTAKGGYYEEVVVQASVPSMTTVSSAVTRCEIINPNTENFIVDEIFLEWKATNSSATESPTFLCAFDPLQAIVCKYNNVKVDECTTLAELKLRVDAYLREFGQDVYNELMKCRLESAATFNGESVAVSDTKLFSVPLSWIFPCIKRLNQTDGVKSIVFEVTFATNYATAAANGLFVTSNTTSNAYSTNLSYSDIQLRQCLIRSNDPDLYVKPMLKNLRIAHEDKIVSASWNSASADAVVRLSIRNDFSLKSLARALKVFIDPVGLRSAYNDADNCIWYSGCSYIGYVVKYNGKIVLDHSHPTNHLHLRKKYQEEQQLKQYGSSMPLALLNRTDGLSKHYCIAQTVIDLSGCIEVYDTHEMNLSGVPSNENIEIILSCAGAISTSVNVHCCLEYIEEIAYDGKGNYKLLQNTL